jgi:hypothetical protein
MILMKLSILNKKIYQQISKSYEFNNLKISFHELQSKPFSKRFYLLSNKLYAGIIKKIHFGVKSLKLTLLKLFYFNRI